MALALLAALSIAIAVQLVGVPAWRQDEFAYFAQYDHRVREEGRWLLALLFPWLRQVHLGAAWLIGFVCFAGFGFRVARLDGAEAVRAASFGLVCALAPTMIAQGTWPAYSLPAQLFLLGLSVAAPHIGPWVFYAVAGVALHATFLPFYFLLPLLHVSWIVSEPERTTRRLLTVLAAWGAGFVLGYAGSLLYLFAVYGQVGLHISPWRLPQPAHDLPSLLHNIGTRIVYLTSHVGLVFALPWWVSAPLAAMVGLNLRGWSSQERVARLVVVLAVVSVLYAVTVTLGVRIHYRTIVATYIGVLALAFVGGRDALHARLFPVAVAAVGLGYGTLDLRNATWLRGVTDGYQAQLRAALPPGRAPSDYAGLVVVRGTACGLQWRIEAAETLAPDPNFEAVLCERHPDARWRPTGIAMGFPDVLFCPKDGPCDTLVDGVDTRACVGPSDAYCVHGVSNGGYLVMSFVDAYPPALSRPAVLPPQEAARP